MAALETITLSPPSGTVYDNGYLQLEALGEFDDATTRPLEPDEVLFTSSDEDVATVSNSLVMSGRVFGVALGTVTITAADPVDATIQTTGAVTVTAPPATTVPAGRFNLAFGTASLDPHPAWTAIDAHPNLVTSYTIDRGRSYELDQTDGGTATVQITDPDGILDPTNPAGPYFGQIRPLLPAVICRQHPVTDAWEERFRGFVEDYAYEVDPSQRVSRLTVSLVDLFELCSSAEMQPGQFGHIGAQPDQIVYDQQQRTDYRIGKVLTELGVPRAMYVTLPGRCSLQETIYSGGESPMTAIQEAADGELPAVANVYCDRHGRLVFHGRKARFDPAGVAAAAGAALWDYRVWKAGDHAAIAASPTDTAQVRGLSYGRAVSKIINAATATEQGVPDEQVAGRRVRDTASINTYGLRSWSASSLLTYQGDLDQTYHTNAATETRRFAQYMVGNYKQPTDRVEEVTLRSVHPDDPRAAANWDLLCGVDIGDTLQLTVGTPGGGGFASRLYFVEGIGEDVAPATPDYDDVTLTLDLSPHPTYNPWVPLTAPDGVWAAAVGHRPGKPKPTPHGREHTHGGPDPVPTDFEDVGLPVGDGGGEPPDLLGYLHYGLNNDDSLPAGPPFGWGQFLTIQTTAGGVLLQSQAGTTLRIDQSHVGGVKPFEVLTLGGTAAYALEVRADGTTNVGNQLELQGDNIIDVVQAMIDLAITGHNHSIPTGGNTGSGAYF